MKTIAMQGRPDHQLTPPRVVGIVGFTDRELDRIAWEFLGSEFSTLLYADWPFDRRVDAYLRHHRMAHVLTNGDAYQAVLHHVLANIGPALRTGVLTNTTWHTARPRRDDAPPLPGVHNITPSL